jgi:hypothetical protein
MRTIVVLLIAALVLTPALAHAAYGVDDLVFALVTLPVLLIIAHVQHAKHKQAAAETQKPCNDPAAMTNTPCDGPTQETPSPLPGEPSESPASTVPAPAEGSDR